MTDRSKDNRRLLEHFFPNGVMHDPVQGFGTSSASVACRRCGWGRKDTTCPAVDFFGSIADVHLLMDAMGVEEVTVRQEGIDRYLGQIWLYGNDHPYRGHGMTRAESLGLAALEVVDVERS